MREESLTARLEAAIALVATSVREIGTCFAIDSSYYKTPNSSLHVHRMGKRTRIVEKVKSAKLHLAAGVKTLMVTAVAVSIGDDHDTTYFADLLTQIARRFRIDEIMADAAYDFPVNYERVKGHGGMAYIDQKSNAKVAETSPHWNEMIKLRNDNFDEWNKHYGNRDLIECVNSIMKRTIKRVIRARLEVSRDYELLLDYAWFTTFAARSKPGSRGPSHSVGGAGVFCDTRRHRRAVR